MPPNFQNGKIYSIRSHQTEHIYIGSTTQLLSQRFSNHKKMRCSSREIMKYDDAYIELIEMFPCANTIELQGREGDVIRTMDCVNKNIPGRTPAEYREFSKVAKNQYQKDNKVKIQQYEIARAEEKKQYNQTHKNIRLCSCGGKYNEGRPDHRTRHYNSDNHIQFVDDFYDRLHRLLVPEDSNE
jgi:hypothetical protein